MPQGVDVVTRTLILDHMNQGRWHAMRDPDLIERLGYYLFDAIIDDRTTVICLEYGGTLLPWDAVFWHTHWPPLHWGCRSIVRMVSRRTAGRRGISVEITDKQPTGGWGLSPDARKGALDFLGTAKHDPGLIEQAKRKIRKKPSEPRVEIKVVPLKPLTPTADQIKEGFNDTPALLGDNVKRVRIIGKDSEERRAAVYSALESTGFKEFWQVKGRHLDSLTITDHRTERGNFEAMSDSIEGAYGLAYSGKIGRNWGGESLKIFGSAKNHWIKGNPLGSRYTSEVGMSTDRYTAADDVIGGLTKHEFGHMVHLNDQADHTHVEIDRLIKNRYQSNDREKITKYADTDHQEYFAEAFAVYHSEDREWLVNNAPKAHKMVEDVLRLRGMFK